MREARRIALQTIGGAGEPPTYMIEGRFALHLRRSLSAAEMSTLSPEWLAIPARDEFAEHGCVVTVLSE